ncbi:hypothetical protein [Nostoc piscinale]|uniref:hypothetical protein n=1 Tax=Nostoc piscinale TaxID=224012 RepID=UPI000B2C2D38|nr:hypothetical protein [Nostoc piscinale]
MSPIYIQIVSQTPGRLRLRISPQNLEQAEIQLTANYLKTFFPQVEQLKVNSQTGSVTFYADANADFAEIIDKLQAQGIIIIETPKAKPQSASFAPSLLELNEQVKKNYKRKCRFTSYYTFYCCGDRPQKSATPLSAMENNHFVFAVVVWLRKFGET